MDCQRVNYIVPYSKNPARIRELANTYQTDCIETRRHLHRNPELSFSEIETSRFITGKLKEYGIICNALRGKDGRGTGLMASIPGSSSGPVLALRADMDALPIQEENDIEYKSLNPGVMHACGHDAHSSIVLTAGRILQDLSKDFAGEIRLIFQPAEEKNPGGARGLISQGVLEGVDTIIGEHINTTLPAGTVGFRPGLMMASADEIYMTIRGKGGHAAVPNKLVDPVLVASHIIVAMQQVVSRRADPQTPSVLSFGKFIAPGAMNVIPNEVEIAGTFRTVDEAWRSDALEKIERIANATAEAMDASCEITIIRGYPMLENDVDLSNSLKKSAQEFIGEEKVQDLPLVMWSEDFAFYNQETRGCFYNLGVGNTKRGWDSPLHSSTLMIDETALETGSSLMAYLALSELQARSK